jgi:hypothetical protein
MQVIYGQSQPSLADDVQQASPTTYNAHHPQTTPVGKHALAAGATNQYLQLAISF